MSLTELSSETITLDILQKHVMAKLENEGLNLVDPQIRMRRMIEFVDGMLVEIKTGVLADHIEHKEATYTTVELPRWLSWLKRFTVTHTRKLSLDAYHTYPKASIKMPKLGSGYVELIKQDYEL